MTCKIGEKIRQLRIQHKMTQEQLADRLGVSYQSVSRWENGVTYPDIEFLPAIAKQFSVSLDYLLGQDDAEKLKALKKRISGISTMKENDIADLIDLIRACRREQDGGDFFEDICYKLRYSPLCFNSEVIGELRKSKEVFFETCSDAAIRSRALGYYVCLEEESHLDALLNSYATAQTTARDYLLKERYLFRDEFDRFEKARQRHFYKQISYLLVEDNALWRDSSKPMNAEQSVFECSTKLTMIHSLCEETPTNDHPITCGNELDVFAEHRITIGMRLACAYVYMGEKEKAYKVLEDVIWLAEKLYKLPNEAELGCSSPALNTFKVIIKDEKYGSLAGKCWCFKLENGEIETSEHIFTYFDSIKECLADAEYSRWGWISPIRKEDRFIKLIERLDALL